MPNRPPFVAPYAGSIALGNSVDGGGYWLSREVRVHAQEFNGPALTAMRLRHMQRLGTLPAEPRDWTPLR